MNLNVLLCTWEKDHNPDFYDEETEDFEDEAHDHRANMQWNWGLEPRFSDCRP